jgi:hypothetical protein
MMDINQNPDQADHHAQQLIRRTKQLTRHRFTPEEKVRILIEGIGGEIPVSVLCSREGIGTAVVRQRQEAGIGALVWDRAPSH